MAVNQKAGGNHGASKRRTPEGSAPQVKGSPPPRSGPQTLLLIDERAGRAVAEAFGIRLACTAAVIGLARQRRLIESAKAVFAELHANDFRIAPAVIQAVLERCGE